MQTRDALQFIELRLCFLAQFAGICGFIGSLGFVQVKELTLPGLALRRLVVQADCLGVRVPRLYKILFILNASSVAKIDDARDRDYRQRDQ